MANLDTAAKRVAGLAATGFILVAMPIPDGSNLDSILQRGHVVFTYAANISQTTPLDLTGVLRTTVGHEFDVEEGHEFAIRAGHIWRIKELK